MAYSDDPGDSGDDAPAATPRCWLCERPLGSQVEWHHPVPKSRKGRETVAVHPICHQTLHARFTNRELERIGTNRDTVLEDGQIARFIQWVSTKDPDFHAPTHKRG